MTNDKAVFEQSATIKTWDQDYYHPVAERLYDGAIALMLRLLAVEEGGTVLDGGCGPGVHSIRVAHAGFQVHAIDLSNAMLQEAGKRVALAGMTKRVIFSQEDLTDLSFPDGTFNHVFSWGVIIHIPDVKRALRELARIVAPGGTLALYITNKTAWDHKLEWLVRFIIRKPNKGRRSLQYGSAVEYELHGEKLWVWQFDIPMVQKLLEANGLTITHRVIGEFSEIQRRVKGPIRFGLLHLNNFLFRLRFPARFGVCNLLVFKKLNAPPGEV